MRTGEDSGCCGCCVFLFGMITLYVLVVEVIWPLILASFKLVVFLVSKVLLGIFYILLAVAFIGVAAGAIALATLLISWALSCLNDLKADADHDVNPVEFLTKLFVLIAVATLAIIGTIRYMILQEAVEHFIQNVSAQGTVKYVILGLVLIALIAMVSALIISHRDEVGDMLLAAGSAVIRPFQWVLSFEKDLLPPPGHRVKPLELGAKLVIVFGLSAFSIIWIIERFFR